MRIFITGGTGLIGTRLVPRLRERGDEVVLLTRRQQAARERFGSSCTIVEGDPTQAGAWMEAINDCDAVVNLAGEGVFTRRWNAAFKASLHDSRVHSAENIVQALATKPATLTGSPKVLVNASAIGYYGPHGDEEIAEEDPPGGDFLAGVCIDWEAAARTAEPLGVRLAILRIGVVLDRERGALQQMLKPFQMVGIGGPVGSGKQWVSWIHHADMVGLILLALDNAGARGPINATAPQPVTNKELTRAQGRALHRPSFLAVPPLALRVMLGQVAEVVATGQRVLPRKALALGYNFQFPTIDAALADILA
jgi:uncharacterized protein (TIGR01777 family)